MTIVYPITQIMLIWTLFSLRAQSILVHSRPEMLTEPVLVHHALTTV